MIIIPYTKPKTDNTVFGTEKNNTVFGTVRKYYQYLEPNQKKKILKLVTNMDPWM